MDAHASTEAGEVVARLVARETSRDDAWVEAQAQAVREIAAGEA